MPAGRLTAPLIDSTFRALRDRLLARPEPLLSQCLTAVRSALGRGALEVALHLLDRAWRCRPQDAEAVASLYARVLYLAADGAHSGDTEAGDATASDFTACLGLLRHARGFAPDPDDEALAALALLRLGRLREARGTLAAALGAHCVLPGGLLAAAAAEVVCHPGVAAAGWIGRGPHLELRGELAPAAKPTHLIIRHGNSAPISRRVPPAAAAGRRRFEFVQPHGAPLTPIEARGGDEPLLGSGLAPAADFGLDGRTTARGAILRGWARLAWLPSAPLRLRCEDEFRNRSEMLSAASAMPARRRPFSLGRRGAGLRGSRIEISARLPDGRWRALPDSPLLLAPAVCGARRAVSLPTWRPRPRRAAPHTQGADNGTDVIIPAYRDCETTLACIESVLATVHDGVGVIVVDDATDDPGLAAALDRLGAGGRVTLLRNAENLGFALSVNRAIALNPARDVVLLNSDTRVYGDWLRRLRAAAHGGARIGTVTPWSNNGSIASYPRPPGGALEADAAGALDALASAAHRGVRAEIPVGVGFCLYIRRDCLLEVGALDARVFGKGYGEETDFCLRARRRGWMHWLAADVFVYHAEGISFGSRRAALLERSERLVNLRHPGYARHIAGFTEHDPLHGLRRDLDELRLRETRGRCVLLVSVALAGGVQRHVTERCRELRARGLTPVVLRAALPGVRERCELHADGLDLPNLQYEIPRELGTLTALLESLRFASVEVHHFLHLDPRLIEAVRALPARYDVFVHDYAWICPRVTLIGAGGRYCGEPAIRACEACVRRNGSLLGERLSVAALRARSAVWLAAARHVRTPSADASARLQRHFPGLTVAVTPIGPLTAAPSPTTRLRAEATAPTRTTAPTPAPAAAPAAAPGRRRVRVALIGAIGTHKGYRVLLACARDARARRLPLEFVVVGFTERDASLLATRKVRITGPYAEPEVTHLLRRERATIAWLPSVWPETWCYALDHALAAGLPVAAFDLGAIAERLRGAGAQRGAGSVELMPPGLAARRINERLLALGGACRPARTRAPDSVQTRHFPAADAATMSIEIRDVHTMNPSSDCLSASVQVLPLPPGLYLFSVKTAGSAPPAEGALALPALHVGLGPGVRSELVDFIAGPATHGAWLHSSQDLLVLRIHGSGATLILTSVRAPGGEVLSIKVERLDNRADAAASIAPASPATAPASPATAAAAAAAAHAAALAAAGATGRSLRPVTTVMPPAPAGIAPLGAADQPGAVEITTHIRSRGDLRFIDQPWAGRIATGLWIESFAAKPPAPFGPDELEYKALTGSGFETNWTGGGAPCGTKGMATPLIGFAVRLKPSLAAAAYDCEYSGYFQSKLTVGPVRNGAPCRSTVANDPLEGIQIRIVRRCAAAPDPALPDTALPALQGAAVPDAALPAVRGIKGIKGIKGLKGLKGLKGAPGAGGARRRVRPVSRPAARRR